MDNRAIARVLSELAALTAVDEADPNAFRVRAYETAARTIDSLTRDAASMSVTELAALKGIGKSTAAKILEIAETGSTARLQQLRAQFPPAQLALLGVPGLGPKTLRLLDEVLGIRDVDALRAALDDGSLATLPGMGEKTQDNLRRSLERSGTTSKENRRPIHVATALAQEIVTSLRDLPGVHEVATAGSLRRFRETIGDVDILVACDDPAPVMKAFVEHPRVSDVVGSGDTKSSIVTWDGMQVDLRAVDLEVFGAALLYFTGSKAHNIRLRQRAIERGWSLSEYGLFEGETVLASASEQELYERLELPWISAELREDNGEIEAAESGDLVPRLEVDHLRGDLHDHTDASGDGRDSLEDLVAAAHERGLDYLAITDHAEDLRINGISKPAMLAQRTQVRTVEQDRGDIRVLHGAELNIGLDGSLDYDQAFLETFDWCVASVHSHFNRSVKEQTARILRAIRNPAVTAIGHLSGRRLGKRPGIDLDLEAVLDAAAETGTAIEINCSLQRLDATVEAIREGAARGVTFVISTDAHATHELDNHRHGVAQARRAGLHPDQIANTWELDRFQSWIDSVRAA